MAVRVGGAEPEGVPRGASDVPGQIDVDTRQRAARSPEDLVVAQAAVLHGEVRAERADRDYLVERADTDRFDHGGHADQDALSGIRRRHSDHGHVAVQRRRGDREVRTTTTLGTDSLATPPLVPEVTVE